jgi:hypothetical protein
MSEISRATGTVIHVNAGLNLVRDTVTSKDPTKCAHWTCVCIRKGAPRDEILDKLIEGGMSEAAAEEHLTECEAHVA